MVKLFTAFPRNPLHPRLEMQLNYFRDQQIEVECFFDDKSSVSTFNKFRTKLCLKYFRWDLISGYVPKIAENGFVHIYDFRLLPLAKYASKKGNKVIYETLDDNVHLHAHELIKKSKFFALVKPLLIWYFGGKEKRLIRDYVNQVIVNSPNLIEISPEKSELIYYASPFEGVRIDEFDSEKETVFVYLGKLTKSKGTSEYKVLQKEFGTQVHFFGEAKDQFSKDWITGNPFIQHHGNMSSKELEKALTQLSEQYNLIGLSIIIPENRSYALQEANKDIDYMCLGIPFIGNERKPTYEKIKAGAGVLFSDYEAISDLMYNRNNRYTLTSQTQHELYNASYSKAIFTQKLAELYRKLI